MEESTSLFEQIYPFLGIFLLVATVLLGLWLFVRWWQRQRRWRQEVAQLGYTPLTAIPSGLGDRVAAVHGRLGDHRLRLGDLFHRPLAAGDLYLFNLLDRGGEESPRTAGVLAIVSSSLDLPRFRLLPRYDVAAVRHGSERMLAVAEQRLEQQGRLGGFRRVALAGSPAFRNRYLVFATDEREMRAFLTPGRREGLATLATLYRIEGVGDTCLLFPHLSPHALARGEHPVVDEAARLADAERLLALFLEDGDR